LTQTPPGTRDYALLVLLSAIWGSSFLFIKLGVETIPAASLTLARLALAAVLLAAVARMAGQAMPRGFRLWALITLAALTGNALPFTLIAWGEEGIDSGLAAILMAVMPLTTVLLAHVFTRDEKMTARKAIGVALGFAGLAVLIGPEKLTQLGEDTVRQLAVAGAAFCYGVNAIVTKGLIGLPRRALAAALMAVSTAMMVPFSLFFDRPWTLSLSVESLAVLAVLGILHTAIGTLIMLALLRRQGASFFAQINFMIPLFGVLFGALVLLERPPPNAYGALALILLGVAAARGRNKTKLPGDAPL
jgi:drug/metabolite transporter (DMT)-like permease